jgi:hypothetical protein
MSKKKESYLLPDWAPRLAPGKIKRLGVSELKLPHFQEYFCLAGSCNNLLSFSFEIGNVFWIQWCFLQVVRVEE